LREFEVVAVDDGSEDETGEVLARWAERDERVRLLRPGRVGLAQALHLGAEACRGELIARFDADDVAHPRRLMEQVAFLRERPDVAAAGTWIRYFPWDRVGWGGRRYQAWLNGLAGPGELARDIFVECPIAHPTLAIRRNALGAAGGYVANGWAEDYDLLLRLHALGARLANVPRVLHFWREGEGRASRSDPRYSPEAFRRCKIEYLRRNELAGRGALAIWGAGRVGKAFGRDLMEAGYRLAAFYDIDPRKIGQEIYGAPVRDAARIEARLDTYLLVAVGTAGARELIRERLECAGLGEPADYRCVA
jgi:glycosyltransferase involved in cell wall biosynthesis